MINASGILKKFRVVTLFLENVKEAKNENAIEISSVANSPIYKS